MCDSVTGACNVDYMICSLSLLFCDKQCTRYNSRVEFFFSSFSPLSLSSLYSLHVYGLVSLILCCGITSLSAPIPCHCYVMILYLDKEKLWKMVSRKLAMQREI